MFVTPCPLPGAAHDLAMTNNSPRSWRPSRRVRRIVVAAAAAGALLGGVTVAAALNNPAGTTASPVVVHHSETESETSLESTTTQGATTTTAAVSTTTMAESHESDEPDDSHESDDPTTTSTVAPTTTVAPTSTTTSTSTMACVESDDEGEDGDDHESSSITSTLQPTNDCESDEESELEARLSGANEVPPNDLGGKGKVEIEVRGTTVCFKLDFSTSTPAVAAHIHLAPVGTNGPVVVPLAPLNPQGKSEGCVSNVDAALAANIAAHPEQYYVNVHTTALPGGDIRGQLKSDD